MVVDRNAVPLAQTSADAATHTHGQARTRHGALATHFGAKIASVCDIVLASECIADCPSPGLERRTKPRNSCKPAWQALRDSNSSLTLFFWPAGAMVVLLNGKIYTKQPE